jgi:hypothetical protein
MTTPQSRRGKPMTLEQLTEKVNELSAKVEFLTGGRDDHGEWWINAAGAFRDDPVFDEIVRLGKQERQAGRPRRKSKRARS